MFGSVCWDKNISKLYRGRLEKIVKRKSKKKYIKKKKKKKAGHELGKLYDSFKILHKKIKLKNLQIFNDPTHPVKHYVVTSRYSNRSG